MLLLALCVVGGGGVSVLPIVGISPAKTETDRAQVRISAIPSRFMVSLLFENYQKSGIERYQKCGISKAHNTVFRADVKNNVGNVLRQLHRFKAAHKYLSEARRLAVIIKDKAVVAQIDDTRAQLLTDEGRLKEAESVARTSVTSLKKSGHQGLLIDSMITHGIVLARLGRKEEAQFTFQNAIALAHQADALSQAGIAALTLIEEIDSLNPDVLAVAYEKASEWLAKCHSQELLLRFKAAGIKLARELQREAKTENVTDLLFHTLISLPDEVLKFERDLISTALAKANGRITHAAKLLRIRYQTLGSIIESRHPELLEQRTTVYRRPRKR